VNPPSDDEGSDIHIKSPLDDIVSPVSNESHPKVRAARGTVDVDAANSVQPSRLNTTLPVRLRADSDDAPQSVIHAPANFKTFVRVASWWLHYMGANTANRTARACLSPRQMRRPPTTLLWCLRKHQKQT
jgi:hypothetical protein